MGSWQLGSKTEMSLCGRVAKATTMNNTVCNYKLQLQLDTIKDHVLGVRFKNQTQKFATLNSAQGSRAVMRLG